MRAASGYTGNAFSCYARSAVVDGCFGRGFESRRLHHLPCLQERSTPASGVTAGETARTHFQHDKFGDLGLGPESAPARLSLRPVMSIEDILPRLSREGMAEVARPCPGSDSVSMVSERGREDMRVTKAKWDGSKVRIEYENKRVDGKGFDEFTLNCSDIPLTSFRDALAGR